MPAWRLISRAEETLVVCKGKTGRIIFLGSTKKIRNHGKDELAFFAEPAYIYLKYRLNLQSISGMNRDRFAIKDDLSNYSIPKGDLQQINALLV